MNDFDDIENKRFLKHDEVFSNFIHGEHKKYFLASKVGKNVNFINLDKKENIINYDFFIQLFVSQDTHFTEESSIKYPVLQTSELQRFEFDLKDFDMNRNILRSEMAILIVAEKSISVSNIINGTTRLQPMVMQIGQAAGGIGI